jgi:site-specific DNA recombinase
MPPLGYDVVERKLVPNPREAARVRQIFEGYIALGSMTTLCRELRAEGVTTKSWTTLKDKSRAGKLIDKGYLARSSRIRSSSGSPRQGQALRR